MLVTNNPTMVKDAKRWYTEYPTIVNALKESGITYSNTKKAYAKMDNKFSGSQMGIGWSSNLAQLAMTYYWTELMKENPDENLLREYYDNFIILSVLAQILIDGCKREYEIDGEEEIKRISNMPCMTMVKEVKENKNKKIKYIKCDFPYFMKYTREIKYTKDGKEIPYDEITEKKSRLNRRINDSLECPMNWLQEWLDKIQGAKRDESIPTSEFFIKINGKANSRQISKIRSLVERYDMFVKTINISECKEDVVLQKIIEENKIIMDELKKVKIGNIVTINRLVETAFGLETGVGASRKLKGIDLKHTRKMLNCLYRMDKDKFLSNFKTQKDMEASDLDSEIQN